MGERMTLKPSVLRRDSLGVICHLPPENCSQVFEGNHGSAKRRSKYRMRAATVSRASVGQARSDSLEVTRDVDGGLPDASQSPHLWCSMH